MAKKETNVLVASFLRPRGFLILILGAGFSLSLALVLKWWLLFGGMFLSLGGYGWSVFDSLNDPLFIEEMGKKALTADISTEAKLTVLSNTGSRHLTGPSKDKMKKIAENGLEIIKLLSVAPVEYKEHLDGVSEKVGSMVVAYEKFAVEQLSIKEADSQRLLDVNNNLDNISNVLASLLEKSSAFSGGSSDLDVLPDLTVSIVSEVESIEYNGDSTKLLT